MTTVAANLECMAADSFFGDGNRGRKIIRVRGALIGYCGDVYYAHRLIEWYTGARTTPAPTPVRDEDDADLLILTRRGILTLNRQGIAVAHLGYAAIGSGRSEAQGAMAVGATPEHAVEAAIKHDVNSKGPVVVEWLRRRK